MLGATKLANAVSNHFLKKAFVEGFKTILKPTDFVGWVIIFCWSKLWKY